jgi:D-3-phosphoglycerate dehydrogenase / 2-oxoglutarate reductase
MMMKAKILITDQIHELFIEEMSAFGCTVDYQPTITKEAVIEIIHEYDILLVNSRIPADKALIDKGINLKVIGRIGSGLEVIDVGYAEQKNIVCMNAPEGNKDAVAEHAIGMLLCLLNNIHIANAQVKDGQWLRETNRGTELGGKTIAIIGFGNNGRAFAEKLKGFNVKLLAYDKYLKNFGTNEIEEATMQHIFEQADIVSLHLPLNEETQYLVNNQFIKDFKKNIYLLNIARGKLINTQHLIENLANKKILGACLDVLENEKLETLTSQQYQCFQQLQQMPNVLLTPHVAGWTHESKIKIAEVLATKLKKLLSKN